MADLNDKQLRFVAEYLVDLNATQAAIRAGYSRRSAEVTGSRLLSNAKVAEAVAAGQQARAERTEITQDRVLQELGRIAFGDLRKVFTPGGNLLSPVDMDDDAAAMLASVEIVTRQRHGGEEGSEVEYIHKVKAWDKLGALTTVARHLGMLKDKVEHSGNVSLEQLVLHSQVGGDQ